MWAQSGCSGKAPMTIWESLGPTAAGHDLSCVSRKPLPGHYAPTQRQVVRKPREKEAKTTSASEEYLLCMAMDQASVVSCGIPILVEPS